MKTKKIERMRLSDLQKIQLQIITICAPFVPLPIAVNNKRILFKGWPGRDTWRV